MKRKVSIFVSALVIVLSVIPFAQAQTTLHWLTWGNIDRDGHLEIARLFEEQNPGVTVHVEQVPFDRYEDKVRTVMAAGDPPDIIQVNDSYVLGYALRDLLLPLDDFMESSHLDPSIQDPFPNAIIGGQRMGFGLALAVRLMYYNVDMFHDAGLDRLPTQWESENWTWDHLIDIAKRLTNPRSNQWGVLIFGDTGWEQIITANVNMEGVFGPAEDAPNQLFLMGREPGISAVQMLADLTHVHQVQPPWGMVSQLGNQGMFKTGRLGIVAGISNNLEEYRRDITAFEWDVAPVPMINRGINETSGRLFGIPKGAKNPELAWRFMEFWMSDEAQSVVARTGYGIPVNESVARREFINPDLLPLNQQVFLDGMAHSLSINQTPATEFARQIYRPQLPRIWSGELTAHDILPTLVEEIEKAIHDAWTGVDY